MRDVFTRLADWRVFAAFLAILFSLFVLTLPLATALQFGADEGMELTKAFIYAKHSELTPKLWNDQPALFTEILSLAFNIFSPTILVARLVTVAFSILISISIWGIAAELAGQGAGVFAVLFFFLSPHVPSLLVSVMLEVPAFSLALASLWMFLAAYRRADFRMLAGSALLYGCALNLKLTPVILFPAFLTYGCMGRFHLSKGGNPDEKNSLTKNGLPPQWHSLTPMALWTLSAGAVGFLLLCFIPPGIHWSLLWKSHVDASGNHLFRASPVYSFNAAETFLKHPEAVLGSVIGYYVLVFTKRWRALVFLTVLALTIFVVHTFHRPWWSYYYLHFAIPMALLSGIGLQALLSKAGRFEGNTPAQAVRSLVSLTALACLLMTLTTSGLPRFIGQFLALRQAPRAGASALLKEIMIHKKQARWLYSLDAKYSFFSQIVSPPEIAVLPVKRFFSGAITFERILAYLKEYEPGEILTTSESEHDPDWISFLARDYIQVYEKNGYALHIRKKLLPEGAQPGKL